jgi:hypothetical protein
MPARLINFDRDTPLLLPPKLRDWVPEDHLVPSDAGRQARKPAG